MSFPAFAQVEPQPFPSGYGEAIAYLRLGPELLAERYGLVFSEGWDNLDAYDAASIRLRSGRRIGLLRHRGSPEPGTEVHADLNDDPQDVVAEVMAAFGLTRADVTWVRPPHATASAAGT